MASLKSQIAALKTQNTSLENSLDTIKQSSKQTVDYQSGQFTALQQRWESERTELLQSGEELKNLKANIVELKKELAQTQESKVAVEKKFENEKQRGDGLEKTSCFVKRNAGQCKKFY